MKLSTFWVPEWDGGWRLIEIPLENFDMEAIHSGFIVWPNRTSSTVAKSTYWVSSDSRLVNPIMGKCMITCWICFSFLHCKNNRTKLQWINFLKRNVFTKTNLLTNCWATRIPSFCALNACMYSWTNVRILGYLPKSCSCQSTNHFYTHRKPTSHTHIVKTV